MSRRILLRGSVAAMAVIVFISSGISLAGAEEKTHTQPSKTEPVKKLPTRKVTFSTEDEIAIVGSYTRPKGKKKDEKAPMVILLHMYNSNRWAYDPLLPHLHDAGFAVLAIDMRGHGESVGPEEKKLADSVSRRDSKLFMAAAYVWLAGRPEVDPARFVLVGASVGCSVALDYAGRDRSVDGVVCMTPGTSYLGIDSVRDARKYGKRPILLLAGESERAAADQLAKLMPEAKLHIVPGNKENTTALHGTKMFGKVNDIEKTITEFLVKAAGKSSKDVVVASVKSNVYHQPDSGTVRLINPENKRWFSSPEEAAARGLRPPKRRRR